MPHAELELTLRALGDGAYVADLRLRDPASRRESELALGVPAALKADELRLLASDAEAYGRALTAQVFSDQRLREGWIKATAPAEREGVAIRVRLRIDPSADALHTLRWETLHDPAADRRLCRSERVLFSRYLDAADLARVSQGQRPTLRALAAIANPPDLGAFNLAPVGVKAEQTRIAHALGAVPLTVLGRDVGQPPATLNGIIAALRDGDRYSVFYLVCHGSIVEGRSFLWLESEDERTGRVASDELVRRIADLPSTKRPLLIVLSACQSAGTSHEPDALRALGPALARAGVAAVLAMQGDMPVETTERLMPAFFKMLVADGQIDRALALARADLPADQPWWMPVLLMQVRDGRLWNDGTATSVVAAPPALPDGLAELARQLRAPGVREKLAEFRTIFSAARDQIGLLNQYKALHDTLQALERPFNLVARDRRRLVENPAAWDELAQPLTELQEVARTALDLMADPRLADESAWGMQQLQLAGADLDMALSQSDPRCLDVAVGRYKRVLARELPRADSRLASCAGDLRLALVTQALGKVQAALVGNRPDLGALRELATWTATLAALKARLDTLVPTHHRWQAVDSELRGVAASLSGAPSDLELAWDDLLRQTTPLFGNVADEWATTLNTLGAQISAALSAGEIPQARRLFITYQSRATRRFGEVDKTLLATCNELREAGAALDLILRTLDEGNL